jgi:Fe-S-cluster-containing hydrogenase component 2
VDRCYVQALQVAGGRAVIGEYCRACGRCATACPNDAIVVSASDPAYLDKAYEEIRARVKFD